MSQQFATYFKSNRPSRHGKPAGNPVPLTTLTPMEPGSPLLDKKVATARDARRWQIFCSIAPSVLGATWDQVQRRVDELLSSEEGDARG